MARVLTPQAEDFPRWYQEVVAKAQLAENGPVRGTMVIRPWPWGIWELLQRALDDGVSVRCLVREDGEPLDDPDADGVDAIVARAY